MRDLFGSHTNKITLLPPFEHKAPEDDDSGLPEHPIYSDYSKHLWTSHIHTGGSDRNIRSKRNYAGRRVDEKQKAKP